jgi:hypothetical protein
MSDKTWKKVSSKRYQIEIDGAYVDIAVPYAKVERIVEAFFANGGMMSEDGQVVTSVQTLIKNFGVLGDILLSKYDSKGDLTEEKGCRDLSYEEVVSLFEIAADILSSFMQAISAEAPKVASEAEVA